MMKPDNLDTLIHNECSKRKFLRLFCMGAIGVSFFGCESDNSVNDVIFPLEGIPDKLCFNEDNEYVANASGNESFAIVSPVNGAHVKSGTIDVLGVGLRGVESFYEQVRTNAWYPQDFSTLYQGKNHTWKYSANLSGVGAYNNHTINIQITNKDGSSASSQVTGIVRDF